MKNKSIRRNLYRVLRKTGVQKEDISPGASYQDDLYFDNVDWSIFTYYLENIFKKNFDDEDLNKFNNINDTLNFLKKSA